MTYSNMSFRKTTMTTAVQEMNLEGGYTIKGLFQELKKM
jgi:hypothetical protein